ncbi:2-phosphosulfolactate phosphatase [Jiangella asiatica]|uniref:Probable 2-phosphosulfolactate phosphatase n=1 Tax=Jiangella asiatica TaxID=2530372 RepID=A0A4R5DFX5_9ACTN|nr:2-phosphosulfolactate phosphatase [Jiangella asiatica]TDE10694.1 hypothetical protein E1269_11525 [Jiangella asiatica]
MGDWFGQDGYDIRFDWGPVGAQRLAPSAAALVVVDVLSFTTSVSVAVEAGTVVFPYAWRDATATAYAQRVGAELAVGRRAVSATAPWSLSPAALRSAPFTPRLVLPSPNGSAIAAAAAGAADPPVVVTCCLRNASAVGRWLAGQGFGRPDRPVAVIAAGERWPDDSLRPALEDLLGAGAIVASLATALAQDQAVLSPEAAAARGAFDAVADDVAAAVTGAASGRELVAYGFPDDVAIACRLDESDVVPVLDGEAFRPA